jgi:hypothetical protein
MYIDAQKSIKQKIFLLLTRQLHSLVKRLKELRFSETQINRKARHIIINWIDAQYGSIFLNNIIEIDEEKKRRTRNQRKSTLNIQLLYICLQVKIYNNNNGIEIPLTEYLRSSSNHDFSLC